MNNFPRPIEGGNTGDGSPLLAGGEGYIGDLYCYEGTINFVDWDGDGERELVLSGSDIFSYKIIDSLPDGTPIVDRGMRWGEMARDQHINDVDGGITGGVILAEDFDGDGKTEVLLASRGYSTKSPVILRPGDGGAPVRRDGTDTNIALVGTDKKIEAFQRSAVTGIDWDGDGKVDIITIENPDDDRWYIEPGNTIIPEDQRERYYKDGRWVGSQPDDYGRDGWYRENTEPELHLYRNTSVDGKIEFTYVGQIPIKLPRHSFFIGSVNPTQPHAGILIQTYYGSVHHLPLDKPGDDPVWGDIKELFTLHNEPFNRSRNFEGSILTSDVIESNRYDLFAFDKSNSVVWCRYHGQGPDGRPIYDNPKNIKQVNPHVNGGHFSVPTVGDWRSTGNADLVVGSVEGYIYWYKTLSTKPLQFAPPERVRQGTEEIRRLARPKPNAGQSWGGSQGPYDGDTGGYSNPVLADWSGDGLLDLIVSDMVSLFDYYPNWGTKDQPELGPPQRLHVNGEPLIGPWRQQPGIADWYGDGIPAIIAQDPDLDLSIYRRAGREDLAGLLPGEKLRYEDGSTIKTHGTYTPPGGDGRGRTKITVVAWAPSGVFDLLIGVGPQHGAPYRSSYVLLAKNIATNEDPVFRKPIILLWNKDGEPQQFWRHGAHPAPVKWNDDGKYGLVVGADNGHVWYWDADHLGSPASGDPTAPIRPVGEEGFGPRVDE